MKIHFVSIDSACVNVIYDSVAYPFHSYHISSFYYASKKKLIHNNSKQLSLPSTIKNPYFWSPFENHYTMPNVRFIDLGMKDYQEAWDFQTQIFNQVWEAKKNNGSPEDALNYLLFCEHPHVYTLGKSGKDANLLINEEQLKSYGATFYKIDRGGDITYHGPGQIVGYPIFDLEVFNLGVKDYVHKIEDSIILTLAHYGIASTRLTGATGVWLDADKPTARKICAIGVKAGHFITMHGFAFNINTDLNFFNYINPCGFVDKGVTSLSKELGRVIDIEEVKSILLTKMEEVFGFSKK